MKEFITAVEEVLDEETWEGKVKALVASGKTREEAEEEADKKFGVVAFKLDDRVLRAHPLSEGQLAFMMASLGRGQTNDQRFASIINIMLASLQGDDKDFLESRLLEPKSSPRRIPLKVLEGIFEHLIEEWFRPSVPDGGAPTLVRGEVVATD